MLILMNKYVEVQTANDWFCPSLDALWKRVSVCMFTKPEVISWFCWYLFLTCMRMIIFLWIPHLFSWIVFLPFMCLTPWINHRLVRPYRVFLTFFIPPRVLYVSVGLVERRHMGSLSHPVTCRDPPDGCALWKLTPGLCKSKLNCEVKRLGPVTSSSHAGGRGGDMRSDVQYSHTLQQTHTHI